MPRKVARNKQRERKRKRSWLRDANHSMLTISTRTNWGELCSKLLKWPCKQSSLAYLCLVDFRDKAEELFEWIKTLEAEKFEHMERLKRQKYEVREKIDEGTRNIYVPIHATVTTSIWFFEVNLEIPDKSLIFFRLLHCAWEWRSSANCKWQVSWMLWRPLLCMAWRVLWWWKLNKQGTLHSLSENSNRNRFGSSKETFPIHFRI